MAFLDFLRKKKEEPVIRKIRLDDLPKLLEDELSVIEEKKKEIRKRVNAPLMILISELKMQIPKLRGVKVREREDERLKWIVKDNFETFVSQLEKLILDLSELDFKQADYLECVQKILDDFRRNSYRNYERSTILIGKDISAVQEKIGDFVRSSNEVIRENVSQLDKARTINKIKALFSELNENRKVREQISSGMKKAELEAERKRDEKSSAEKEFENFKKSSEYETALKEREERERKILELRAELFRIKDKINIKELVGKHYRDERKASLLRKYQDNFFQALEEDFDFEFGKLIEPELGKRVLELRDENDKLKEEKKSRSAEFEDILKRASFEFEEARKKSEEEKRKLERFDDKEIISNIKISASEIDISVL